MNRVDVIVDMEPYYLLDENDYNTNKKPRHTEKTIKISDEMFEHALKEGLIEKTEDGYVFIGKYEDVKAFRKNKKKPSH
ncbi:MAG: hypothetical protein QXS02_06570 [Candidatus Thermoplasmatota archaeon]